MLIFTLFSIPFLSALISHLNVYLAQLLLRYLAGCSAHEILCIAVHREGDDLTDVLLIPQQHDHTIHAGSHSCVRGCSELECLIESSELRLQCLFIVTRNGKSFFHDLDIVVTYCTGGQLHAVAYDVVLVCQNV